MQTPVFGIGGHEFLVCLAVSSILPLLSRVSIKFPNAWYGLDFSLGRFSFEVPFPMERGSQKWLFTGSLHVSKDR